MSIKCVLRGFAFPQTVSVHHLFLSSAFRCTQKQTWLLSPAFPSNVCPTEKKKSLIVTRVHTNYRTAGLIQQHQQLINTMIPCHMGFFSTLYLIVLEK